VNKSMLRIAALVGVSALVVVGPAGAAAKKKAAAKPAKKPAVTATTIAATTPPPAATTPPPSATTPPAPAAAAKPSGSTIKVGLLSAETGNASSAYKNAPAVGIAWAKWVNETQGGVGGHPIEVITADDKNNAADAIAGAKDLIENKNVVALVVQDSTAETGIAAYINEKKFPVIGGSANNGSLVAGNAHGMSPYYFTTAPAGLAAQESPVVIANFLGQKPYTAAVCAEVAACAAGAATAANKAKATGLEYAGVLTVLGSSPNYTAECLEVMSRIAGASRTSGYVSIGLAPTAMARLINDCVRQGYGGFFGASSNTASEAIFDTIPVDNLRIAGYVNGFPWWSTAAPVKNFKDQMAKYAPKAEYRDPAATTTWSALELFRKTMSKASANVTKDEVLTAYYKIKDENLDGLLPLSLTFTEGKAAPLPNCYWAYKYEKKSFTTLVLDAKTTGNGQTGDLRTYCG
jgi:branched-chain amino acid transport system substrate-binding protein